MGTPSIDKLGDDDDDQSEKRTDEELDYLSRQVVIVLSLLYNDVVVFPRVI
jgi:hypothetical protein